MRHHAEQLLHDSHSGVKPVPDMTYNVFSGTLNPTQSINHSGALCPTTAVTYPA